MGVRWALGVGVEWLQKRYEHIFMKIFQDRLEWHKKQVVTYGVGGGRCTVSHLARLFHASETRLLVCESHSRCDLTMVVIRFYDGSMNNRMEMGETVWKNSLVVCSMCVNVCWLHCSWKFTWNMKKNAVQNTACIMVSRPHQTMLEGPSSCCSCLNYCQTYFCITYSKSGTLFTFCCRGH